MKVWIQLHDAQERTYESVTQVIEDSVAKAIKLYQNDKLLAVIAKSDLKNLLTECTE
jgi:hypothetical protein